MLKRSIIFISTVLLSCFYLTSCKSSSAESFVYLAIDTSSIKDDVRPYLNKIRIVAISSNESCPANKKIVTLGAPTDEVNIDNSFIDENNFVDIENDNVVKLKPDCLPYNITLGYWCKDNNKNDNGLCYKNDKPKQATTENIVDLNGYKALKLSFELQSITSWRTQTTSTDPTTQNIGVSTDTTPKAVSAAPVSEQKEVKLANILNESSCLYKPGNEFTFLDQMYNNPTQNQNGKRRFYFIRKDACSSFLKTQFECQTVTYNNVDNQHFINLAGNSTNPQVIASINNTKFYDNNPLENFLQQTSVSTEFKIKILDLPKPNTEKLTLTAITCTKK